MKRSNLLPLSLLAAAALLAACGEQSRLPDGASTGPSPTLPEPTRTMLPTIQVAKAVGWADGALPSAAAGLQVAAMATGLDHPRWLHVLPNGDVLVAESNAPKRPERDELLGLKGKVMGWFMKRAGAGVPSANRITLLRDADGDGRAEVKSAFLENLNSPFGMAQVGDKLYVANTDAVMEFDYKPGETRIAGAGKKLTDLPGGPLNHHWTRP
jgi:glucose/arabinose dehydrogenase